MRIVYPNYFKLTGFLYLQDYFSYLIKNYKLLLTLFHILNLFFHLVNDFHFETPDGFRYQSSHIHQKISEATLTQHSSFHTSVRIFFLASLDCRIKMYFWSAFMTNAVPLSSKAVASWWRSHCGHRNSSRMLYCNFTSFGSKLSSF